MSSEICRICRNDGYEVYNVCNCKGSIGYVHIICLLRWLDVKNSRVCEICGLHYRIWHLIGVDKVFASIAMLLMYGVLVLMMTIDLKMHSLMMLFLYAISQYMDSDSLAVKYTKILSGTFLLIVVHPVFYFVSLCVLNMYIAHTYASYLIDKAYVLRLYMYMNGGVES